jgi:hypothetical protein
MYQGVFEANLTQQFVEVNETAFSKILKKVCHQTPFQSIAVVLTLVVGQNIQSTLPFLRTRRLWLT